MNVSRKYVLAAHRLVPIQGARRALGTVCCQAVASVSARSGHQNGGDRVVATSLGGEMIMIVTKGAVDVHFVVKLTRAM